MDIVQPKAVLFVKYEFWYHFMREAKRRQIPVLLFSAIFRDNQLFFKHYGGFYRDILKYYTKIFVQNRRSVELLQQYGIRNVEEIGDTRFDRVIAIAEQRKIIPEVEQFKADHPLMVIGSSWPADLAVLLPIIESFRELKFIVAPHEIKERDIESLIRTLKRPAVRYSQLQSTKPNRADVLVIDNIGLLSSLYGYADFAYVGGAFGRGLHNILEAAVFGIPVFFGSNYEKFKEATDLIRAEGAFSVRNAQELSEKLTELLRNEDIRKNYGSMNKRYVYGQRGASEAVYHALIRELKSNIHPSEAR